jgi:hypothetical protein
MVVDDLYEEILVHKGRSSVLYAHEAVHTPQGPNHGCLIGSVSSSHKCVR